MIADFVELTGGWIAAGGTAAAIGWWLARLRHRRERARLQQTRELLDAEWQALDGTRRVREVFMTARRAMQQTADREQQERRP